MVLEEEEDVVPETRITGIEIECLTIPPITTSRCEMLLPQGKTTEGVLYVGRKDISATNANKSGMSNYTSKGISDQGLEEEAGEEVEVVGEVMS